MITVNAQHKEQRVGVFIDVQNMYYSARKLHKSKVNFNAILKEAVKERRLIRALAYVIKAEIGDEKKFFTALEKIGFEIRSKDLQTFHTGDKKGDWDVGIAMDVIKLASKLDIVVLVSGDGDFTDLLHYLNALGCRTEVIAFKKTASSKLIEESNQFIDLDSNKRRFLIKKA